MIAVIIPTLNEEKTIRQVIEGFPESYRGHEVDITVIDGGSTDDTCEIVRETGAELIDQRLSGGKGNGVRQALEQVEADLYVMIDGDGTYEPSEMEKLVDPLLDGEAGHVIGWRKNREKGSIPFINRFGNRFFNFATRLTTGVSIHDMLSGYRAFTDESLKQTSFTRPGFGIETEMTMTAIENDVKMKEIPIIYRKRKGKSKLHPFKDGWRIINTLVWSIRDTNPLKFFSAISLLVVLAGLYPAYLTVEEKLTLGYIEHLGPPIAAGTFLIVAVLFLIFGMLADQIKNAERRLKTRV